MVLFKGLNEVEKLQQNNFEIQKPVFQYLSRILKYQ